LTVIGTGPRDVTDVTGGPLDCRRAGDPGSDYVTMVTAADLVLTTTNPAIFRAYKEIVSHEAASLDAAGLDRGAAPPDR
jgi:hypothetical protein